MIKINLKKNQIHIEEQNKKILKTELNKKKDIIDE